MSSTKTLSVTFTYGREDNAIHHARSVTLFYSDIQRMLYLFRYHGYAVRYFIAGEFGKAKGRTHWHGVLHFDGAVPPYTVGRNRQDWYAVKPSGTPIFRRGSARQSLWWPHGHVNIKEAHSGSVRYVCKYILKDQYDEEAQGLLNMSRMPPLGYRYFQERARAMADQRLTMHAPEYSFPHVRYVKGPKAGSRRLFRLRGKSEALFVEAYLARWREVWEGEPPQTQYLTEWDKGWKRELRRIKERQKERGEKAGWSAKDHMSAAWDFERSLAVRADLREWQELEARPQVKRPPRDIEEWEAQFERDWRDYHGKAQIGRRRIEHDDVERFLREQRERERKERATVLRALWEQSGADKERYAALIKSHDDQLHERWNAERRRLRKLWSVRAQREQGRNARLTQ